jgi:hypothetical protein
VRETPDHHAAIEQIQGDAPGGEHSLHQRVAEIDEAGNAQHQHSRTHPWRGAKGVVKDRAAGGADDGQNQHERRVVQDFVQDPTATDQVREKGAVVQAAGEARELEGDRQDDAPDNERRDEPHQAGQGPIFQKELDQFAARGVTAADDHGLEYQARHEPSLKPM